MAIRRKARQLGGFSFSSGRLSKATSMPWQCFTEMTSSKKLRELKAGCSILFCKRQRDPHHSVLALFRRCDFHAAVVVLDDFARDRQPDPEADVASREKRFLRFLAVSTLNPVPLSRTSTFRFWCPLSVGSSLIFTATFGSLGLACSALRIISEKAWRSALWSPAIVHGSDALVKSSCGALPA